MIEFAILQIKDVEHTDYAFRGYDPKKFRLDDYQTVYEGKIDEELFPKSDYPELHDNPVLGKTLCECLFEIFNLRRPVAFKGHSLSVSDIVLISDENKTRLYYCDMVGWVRIK